jgi:hypothetical protein
MRKAFEAYFHSDEQVREYVAKSVALVDDLNVPGDLREAAFAQAVQLLAQKQVTFEQIAPTGVLLGQNHQG